MVALSEDSLLRDPAVHSSVLGGPLIDVSGGALIDEGALVAAVRAGRISASAGRRGVEPIPARALGGIKPGLHAGLERTHILSSEPSRPDHFQRAQRELRELLEVAGQHRLERLDLRQMGILLSAGACRSSARVLPRTDKSDRWHPRSRCLLHGAADNPLRHDNRLGSGLGDERQQFFRHPDVVADGGLVLRKSASKVIRLGVLARQNADREFGRHGIVRAIERDRCERPAPESSLGPPAQSQSTPEDANDALQGP